MKDISKILKSYEGKVYVFWATEEQFFFGKIKNGIIHELEYEKIDSYGYDDDEGVGTDVYKVHTRKVKTEHSEIALSCIDGELSLSVLEYKDRVENYVLYWMSNLNPVDPKRVELRFAYN